jgi:asparaginyl-tRNA synthetase
MIEPEMAFYDLLDNMRLAEEFLKQIVRDVLDSCQEDLAFFDQHIQEGVSDRLSALASRPFSHMTYSDAVQVLQKSGVSFDFPVAWGVDLQSEHERFLTEKYVGGPLILTDYPATIKSFYMRSNDDDRTVAAMDVLVPGVGEIIGGSQREERLDVLKTRMAEQGLDEADYWWYLDLRRFGSAPHSGFGLGLDRMVLYASGMSNIRDVVPFPRFPGSAEF